MNFEAEQTFYDILEVSPDATAHEVREAYFRAKAAYKKGSVALYSLMSPEETQEILEQIEIAYQILSNPEKRRQYDTHHGFIQPEDEKNKIVSIDRVPPMEEFGLDSEEEDLLVAPRTDFQVSPELMTRPTRRFDPDPSPLKKTPTVPKLPPALNEEIEKEMDWSGRFLRKIREAKGISIEEMANYTKLSKTYIIAIEEENYEKLPAPVYLRGFVTLIAKGLSLPFEKVAPAYMARYHRANADTI